MYRSILLLLMLILFLTIGSLPIGASEEGPAYENDILQFVEDITSQLRVERRAAIKRISFSLDGYDYWEYREHYDSMFPYIIESLYDEDYWVAYNASLLIQKFVSQNMYVFYPEVERELYNDLHVEVATNLILCFSGANGIGSEYYYGISLWVDSEDAYLRSCVAFALSELIGGMNDDMIIEILINMLNDESEWVLKSALKGLIKAGKKAKAGLPILEILLNSEYDKVVSLAQEAIEAVKMKE